MTSTNDTAGFGRLVLYVDSASHGQNRRVHACSCHALTFQCNGLVYADRQARQDRHTRRLVPQIDAGDSLIHDLHVGVVSVADFRVGQHRQRSPGIDGIFGVAWQSRNGNLQAPLSPPVSESLSLRHNRTRLVELNTMGTNSGWVVGWADLAALAGAAGKPRPTRARNSFRVSNCQRRFSPSIRDRSTDIHSWRQLILG